MSLIMKRILTQRLFASEKTWGTSRRKEKTAVLILAVTCVLAGCGGSKTPEVSSLSVAKDGKVSHQIVGQFEQDYYEKDGLMTLAQERVAEYCADNGEGSVVLGEVDEQDGKVLIHFDYASGDDYSAFNNRTLFVGTLEEAEGLDYNLDYVAFVSPKGQPMEVSGIEEPEKKQIMIIGMKPAEELLVNVSGKVLYINQSAETDLDVSFAGKSGVNISYPALETEGKKSALSYIIFE